ncbi:MAG TPA: RNA methyltransferase substrate-binding domain-containing protein, partial [Bacillota bacterium]|nr:RNA methyltransferase substrate-binding domain-containing protein [Bacillota bacterium]
MSERIIGRNAVLEALKSGHSINKVIIAKGTSGGSMGAWRDLAFLPRLTTAASTSVSCSSSLRI